MFPVVTEVIGVQWLNYPNVCTEEPLPNSAFCSKHCTLAKEQNIPIKLKEYIHFLNTKGNLLWTCTISRMPNGMECGMENRLH